jgi:hypothetical protein
MSATRGVLHPTTSPMLRHVCLCVVFVYGDLHLGVHQRCSCALDTCGAMFTGHHVVRWTSLSSELMLAAWWTSVLYENPLFV